MFKKTLTLLAVACMATATNLNAAVVQKSPQDVKIYINPGHGGFNSNCRPMGTVKRGANVTTSTTAEDTTAFFESNTNLWKCLAMYHKLLDYGVPANEGNALYDSSKDQHIVMSRITNGSATDRGLSTDIAVEVEKFSPDIFISVHSNASPDGSIGGNENYPLVIYRGEDYRSTAFTDTSYGKNWDYAGTGLNGAGSSYEFGKLVYSHLATIEHEPYTNEWENQYVSGYTPLKTGHNVRGDVNLRAYFDQLNNVSGSTLTSNRGNGTTNSYSGIKYYGYYGVMKHGAVGVLSEGYMHTYYPSVNRHMNKDVCAIEGIAYAHAIADYFGWEKEKTGYIYGIVRDRNQTFTHTYYIPNQNSDDVYRPLNNCTVKLYKDGVLIDTYVTDDEYNGAYVFYDLEPGEYTLDYECDGYQAASESLKSTVVTVKANEISYPKAFLNAEGYTMNSGVSMSTTPVATHSTANWYGGSSTNKIYPRQIAVSNDVVYLIMVGGKRISYWNAADNTEGSFQYGAAGGNGLGICTDDHGNVIFASSAKTASNTDYNARLQQVTVLAKSSGPGEVVSIDNAKDIDLSSVYTKVLSGSNSSGTTTTNSSGITRVIRASGNCYTGEGALWLTNGRDVVKITIKDGVATQQDTYTTPLTDSDFSGSFGGSHNEDMAKESSFFPYTDGKYMMIGRNGTFLCTLNGSAVDGFEYVENTWYAWNSADIEYIGGHEIIVHQATANSGLNQNGKITIIDRTTGTTLASGIDAYGSTATPVTSDYLSTSYLSVNAWCEFDVIDQNTLALYTYVPNNGLAKYLINYNSYGDDPVATPVAAVAAETGYTSNITVTWEAPTTWTETPDNYLVKYQTSYVNAAGETVTSDWLTAGMTTDATCEFVHENARFAVADGQIYPMTYSYKIIPNFNCYDGEVSEISNVVTVEFNAPEPQMDEFSISAVCDTTELKQYDGAISWQGAEDEENDQYSLQGYKFELYSNRDSSTPIASFTFNAGDSKYFGTIDSETGEGAILDDNGNAIENLTYSTADGNYLFKYNVADLDVLDIVNGNEVDATIFTAYVSAMFNIEDTFVYSAESVKKIAVKQYDLAAPGAEAKVYSWKENCKDANGNLYTAYWAHLDITEPDYGDSEAIPVSHYLISMDKDKDGTPDEYVTELYVYDAAGSLGMEAETDGDLKNHVLLTAPATMSMRSTTTAAQLPGTYDFNQTVPSDKAMANFAISAYDSENPKDYSYIVEAVYAAGNEKITSATSVTVDTPADGGVITGVRTIESDGTEILSVYPVPASASVTVKAAGAIESIELYNEAGVTIKSLNGNGSNVMTVNVSDLEAGIYFLRVNDLSPVKIVKK